MREPVLLFAIDGKPYAVAAASVGRVGRPAELGGAPRAETRLGRVREGERALQPIDGGDPLLVDKVFGMLTPERIHPLPALAAVCLPHGIVAGLVETDDGLLPLLDLRALLQDARNKE